MWPFRKKIDAAVPSARTLYRFRPRKTFTSTETGSEYIAGMTYNVREGNDKLNRLVEGWLKDNKVEVV